LGLGGVVLVLDHLQEEEASQQDDEGHQHGDAGHADAQLELLELPLRVTQFSRTHHMVCSLSARRCGMSSSQLTTGQRIAPAIGPTSIAQPGKLSPATTRTSSATAWPTSRIAPTCSACSPVPNQRMRR